MNYIQPVVLGPVASPKRSKCLARSIGLQGADGFLADWIDRYQLDIEVAQQTKQSVECLLIGYASDEVSQSSMKMSGLEVTECGEKGGTEPSTHCHLKCTD